MSRDPAIASLNLFDQFVVCSLRHYSRKYSPFNDPLLSSRNRVSTCRRRKVSSQLNVLDVYPASVDICQLASSSQKFRIGHNWLLQLSDECGNAHCFGINLMPVFYAYYAFGSMLYVALYISRAKYNTADFFTRSFIWHASSFSYIPMRSSCSLKPPLDCWLD